MWSGILRNFLGGRIPRTCEHAGYGRPIFDKCYIIKFTMSTIMHAYMQWFEN